MISQVRIEELNESEPSMKCRENVLSAKTAGLFRPEDKCSGHLFIGYTAGVIKGARLLFRLSYGTGETKQGW